MKLYKLIHFCFGEYVFESDAASFVRLSSEAAKRRIHFWGTELSEGSVRFKASLFSAEEIASLSSELGVKAELISKKGFPFFFSRYRKRFGLIAGLFIGMFLMLYSQLFVWKITVSGNSAVSTHEIEQALSECGIEVGSYIPGINVERDSNKLLLTCRDLSSAAINVNGTHISVIVLERTHTPELDDATGFYNVVASRDGIILDIDAADGTPEVSEGDVVYEGELLINSFVIGNYGTFRPTHARGAVYAAVKERFSIEIPLNRISKHYTGNTETKRKLKLLAWEIPLFFSESPSFEYFDSLATEKSIKLFGFIELPLKQYKVVYSEYILTEQTIEKSVAERLALEELDALLAELDCEVLSLNTEFDSKKENGFCLLKAEAVLKMNIAKEVVFDIKSNQTIFERFPIARE
ncbi:MAG: sporulation protein YqfD [Clostridia bacterium]|nr:sporulation protein YqfD [Clostridia bacterium]